jgi:hypothetical protein
MFSDRCETSGVFLRPRFGKERRDSLASIYGQQHSSTALSAVPDRDYFSIECVLGLSQDA